MPNRIRRIGLALAAIVCSGSLAQADEFSAKLNGFQEVGGADSDGSRPGFRDDLARHSDLMSLAVPR